MTEIVTVQNVTKQFQQKKAVNHINFSINQGEVVAILGPNGAGKTTTLSMLLGLLKPSEGEIKLFGSDPQDKIVRERIGAMLQEVSVIPGLKVIEILQLIRSYYPNPLPLQDLVELTGLTDGDLKTMAEKLSGGQKRRLSFALAIAGNPELILLDEPTVGMDITSRNRFWQTIHAMAAKGKSIIFSTHYLQEADEAAQRILLFKDGAIAADGTPGEIKSNRSIPSISFTVDAAMSLESLSRHPEIEQVHRKNNRIYLHSGDTDRLLEIIFEEKLGAKNIQIEQGKLEDAFEELITEHKEAM